MRTGPWLPPALAASQCWAPPMRPNQALSLASACPKACLCGCANRCPALLPHPSLRSAWGGGGGIMPSSAQESAGIVGGPGFSSSDGVPALPSSFLARFGCAGEASPGCPRGTGLFFLSTTPLRTALAALRGGCSLAPAHSRCCCCPQAAAVAATHAFLAPRQPSPCATPYACQGRTHIARIYGAPPPKGDPHVHTCSSLPPLAVAPDTAGTRVPHARGISCPWIRTPCPTLACRWLLPPPALILPGSLRRWPPAAAGSAVVGGPIDKA